MQPQLFPGTTPRFEFINSDLSETKMHDIKIETNRTYFSHLLIEEHEGKGAARIV
jgi:hypothetical protein